MDSDKWQNSASTDEAYGTSNLSPEPNGDSAVNGAPASTPTVTFRGNSYDLMSVVGVTIAGTVLFTCFTLNMGFYCLPMVSLVLGAIGLASVKESADPDRTRLLSWFAVGSSLLVLLFIGLFIVIYVLIIVYATAYGGGFKN